jgi:hypothetical protein
MEGCVGRCVVCHHANSTFLTLALLFFEEYDSVILPELTGRTIG